MAEITFEEAQATRMLEGQIKNYYRNPVPRFTATDAGKTILARLFNLLLGRRAIPFQIAWQEIVGEFQKYKGKYQQAVYADYVVKSQIEQLAQQAIKHVVFRPLGLYEQRKYGHHKMLGVKVLNTWSHWVNSGLDRFAEGIVKNPKIKPWSWQANVAKRLFSARDYVCIGVRKNILVPRSGIITFGSGSKEQGKRINTLGALILALLESLYGITVGLVLEKIGVTKVVYQWKAAVKTFAQGKLNGFLIRHPTLAKISQGIRMAGGAAWGGVKAAIPASIYGYLTYTLSEALLAKFMPLPVARAISAAAGTTVGLAKFGTGLMSNLAKSQSWIHWTRGYIPRTQIMWQASYGNLSQFSWSERVFAKLSTPIQNFLSKGIRFYQRYPGGFKQWFLRNQVAARGINLLRRIPFTRALTQGGFKVFNFFRNFPKRFPTIYNTINNFFNPGLFLGYGIGQAIGLPFWQSALMAAGSSIAWTLGQRALFSIFRGVITAAPGTTYATAMTNFVRGSTGAGFLGQLLGFGLGFIIQAAFPAFAHPFLVGQLIGAVAGTALHLWAIHGFSTAWIGGAFSGLTGFMTGLFGTTAVATISLWFSVGSIVLLGIFVVIVVVSALIIPFQEMFNPTAESPCFIFNITAHNANSHGSLDVSSLSLDKLQSLSQTTTREAKPDDFILIHKEIITKQDLKSSEPYIIVYDEELPGLKLDKPSWRFLFQQNPASPPPINHRYRIFQNNSEITDQVAYMMSITREHSYKFSFKIPITEEVSTEEMDQTVEQVLRRYYAACPETKDCDMVDDAQDNYDRELEREEQMLKFKQEGLGLLNKRLLPILESIVQDQPLGQRTIDRFESFSDQAQTNYETQNDYNCKNQEGNINSFAFYICDRQRQLEECSQKTTNIDVQECQKHNNNIISVYQNHLGVYQVQASTAGGILEFLETNQNLPENISFFINSQIEAINAELEQTQGALEFNKQMRAIAKNPEKYLEQIHERTYYTAAPDTTFDIYYIAQYLGPEDEAAHIKGNAYAKIPTVFNLPQNYCRVYKAWALNSEIAALAQEFIEIIRKCYGNNVGRSEVTAEPACLVNEGFSQATANIIINSATKWEYLQCVGFAAAFEKHTGSNLKHLNAANYAHQSVPGYRFEKNPLDAQPGDFLIFRANSQDLYGHIVLIIDVIPESASYIKFIIADANADRLGGLRDNGIYYSSNPSIAGFLRRY